MPASSAGRDPRRSSKSGPAGSDAPKSAVDRREKAKSSQSYSAAYNEARRGSVQPSEVRRGSAQPNLGSIVERPTYTSRTNSAPSVDVRTVGGRAPERTVEDARQELETSDMEAARGAMSDGQDEDEVAGVVGAVRQYQPFQSPEVAEPLQEINIAVIGAEGVGKSTFVQKAFDLPCLPPSLAAERRIPIDGSAYLVRLLEVPIDDVYVDDDDTVGWPDTIEDKVMPRIDGAIAMYDVQDKGSFDDVPEVLSE
ncbi:hypothetical protein LTR08_001754 [Meristemomyces frigidus]|nr:hypothetical protein LTR08_001754 [Meristemomyces frigidus]